MNLNTIKYYMNQIVLFPDVSRPAYFPSEKLSSMRETPYKNFLKIIMKHLKAQKM